jgi:hypothetical protein
VGERLGKLGFPVTAALIGKVAMDDGILTIEFTGEFADDRVEQLETAATDDLVEVALGSGFGAERVLKFVSGLSKPALDLLKKLTSNALQADRVTDVVIKKDGVTIGSMRASDGEKVYAFITDVLSKLDGRKK